MGRKYNIPNKPKWYRDMGQDDLLGVPEVSRLFGFTEPGLRTQIYLKRFPKPDEKVRGSGGPDRSMWHKATIDAEIARRKGAN